MLLFAAPAPSLAGDDAAKARLEVGLKAFQDGFHGLAVKELAAYLDAAPNDPRRVDILFVLAQAHIASANLRGAQKVLEEIESIGELSLLEGRYWLGWVLAKQEKNDKALQHLKKYIAEEGGSRLFDALILASDLARNLDDLKTASSMLEKFLKQASVDLRRPQVWQIYLRTKIKLGDAGTAKNEALKAANEPWTISKKDDFEAVALLGIEAARLEKAPKIEADLWSLLRKKGSKKELLDRAPFEEGSARRRAGENASAKKLLTEYLQKHPKGSNAVSARLLLAEIATDEGRKDEGLVHLEEALTLGGGSSTPPRLQEIRESAFSLALALKNSKKAAFHARELLKAGAKLKPATKALAHQAAAAAEAESGNAVEAYKHWKAIPPESKIYKESRLSGSRWLMEKGKHSEAYSLVQPLLQTKQADAETLLTALSAAEGAGEKRKAAEICLTLADNPPKGGSGEDFLYRAIVVLAALKDNKAYAAGLEKLTIDRPQHEKTPWAAGELQRLAFESRSWDKALKYGATAKKQKDNDTAAYLEAETLLNMGREAEARAAFQLLSNSSGPYKGASLARIGSILDKEGKTRQAKEMYAKAIEAGLEGKLALWVKSRLTTGESIKNQKKINPEAP